MKWFHVLLNFLPAILGMIKPELAPIGGGIAIAVSDAEKLWGPQTGPQKLIDVQNLARDLAATANLAHDPTGATTLIDLTTLKDTVAAGLTVGIGVVNLLTKHLNTPGAIVPAP